MRNSLLIFNDSSIECYFDGRLVEKKEISRFPEEKIRQFHEHFAHLSLSFSSFEKTTEEEKRSVRDLFQRYGNLLLEATIPESVKKMLFDSDSVQIFIAADKFRHLRWELLHDGNTFLCLKNGVQRLHSLQEQSAFAFAFSPGDRIKISLWGSQPDFKISEYEFPPNNLFGIPENVPFISPKLPVSLQWSVCSRLTKSGFLSEVSNTSPHILYLSGYITENDFILEKDGRNGYDVISKEEMISCFSELSQKGLILLFLNLRFFDSIHIHDLRFTEVPGYSEISQYAIHAWEESLFRAGVPHICSFDALISPVRIQLFLQRFIYMFVSGNKVYEAYQSALNFLASDKPLVWDRMFIRLVTHQPNQIGVDYFQGAKIPNTDTNGSKVQDRLPDFLERKSFTSSACFEGKISLLNQMDEMLRKDGKVSVNSRSFEDAEIYLQEWIKQLEQDQSLGLIEIRLPKNLLRFVSDFSHPIFEALLNKKFRQIITYGFLQELKLAIFMPSNKKSGKKILFISNDFPAENSRNFLPGLLFQSNDYTFSACEYSEKETENTISLDNAEFPDNEFIKNFEVSGREILQKIDPWFQNSFFLKQIDIFGMHELFATNPADRQELAEKFLSNMENYIGRNDLKKLVLLLLFQGKIPTHFFERICKNFEIRSDSTRLEDAGLIKISADRKWQWVNSGLDSIFSATGTQFQQKYLEPVVDQVQTEFLENAKDHHPEEILIPMVGLIDRILGINPKLASTRFRQIGRKYYFGNPKYKKISRYIFLKTTEIAIAENDQKTIHEILNEYPDYPYLIPKSLRFQFFSILIDFLNAQQNWGLYIRFNLFLAEDCCRTGQRERALKILDQVLETHSGFYHDPIFHELFPYIFEFFSQNDFLREAGQFLSEYFELCSQDPDFKPSKEIWIAGAMLSFYEGRTEEAEKDLLTSSGMHSAINVLDIYEQHILAKIAAQKNEVEKILEYGTNLEQILEFFYRPALMWENSLRTAQLLVNREGPEKGIEKIIKVYECLKYAEEDNICREISDKLGEWYYKSGNTEKSARFYALAGGIKIEN